MSDLIADSFYVMFGVYQLFMVLYEIIDLAAIEFVKIAIMKKVINFVSKFFAMILMH